MTPDGTSTYFLARHIGLRRAMELTLTNRVLSAQEALDWGLVNMVVPDEDVDATATSLAERLAAGASRSIVWRSASSTKVMSHRSKRRVSAKHKRLSSRWQPLMARRGSTHSRLVANRNTEANDSLGEAGNSCCEFVDGRRDDVAHRADLVDTASNDLRGR